MVMSWCVYVHWLIAVAAFLIVFLLIFKMRGPWYGTYYTMPLVIWYDIGQYK